MTTVPTLSTLARAAIAALALGTLLAACGGGADDGSVAATASASDGRRQALKGGGDCTGSCTGGGGDPVAGTNPLPTTAPAPDVVVRESFGPGPDGIRPKGGKGDLRSTFVGTTLGGYWVEWRGDKNNAWITPAGEATWKFTAGSSGGPNWDPYELPSPLEVDTVYGQVYSDVSDGAAGGYPTALLPVAWPAGGWSMSIEGLLWSQSPASTLALGLTDSGITIGNLASASRVTLRVRPTGDGQTLAWELWQGVTARSMLAGGVVEDQSLNQLRIDYLPATQQLSVRVNGVVLATHTVALGRPRYAAFEGHGIVDNFVVRRVGTGAP